jgi:hypothetical protein
LAAKLPRRRVSTLAAALVGILGAALMLAAFRVDAPMLTGGDPETWNGWAHGIAFLAIIATGVLAPLAMALALRRDARWRPIAPLSLAAAVLFVVFLLLPWGNATFLLASSCSSRGLRRSRRASGRFPRPARSCFRSRLGAFVISVPPGGEATQDGVADDDDEWTAWMGDHAH